MQHILVRFILLGLMLLNAAQMSAQIRTYLNIQEDTVAIGRHFHVALSLTYPAGAQVVFPDTSIAFAPYEWVATEYFPTEKRGSKFFDSIIYTLRTFEINPVQKIKLNLNFIQNNDTIHEFTPEDSFKLAFRIISLQDSLSLKSHTDIISLTAPTDYAGIFLIIIFLILLLGLLFFLLRKPVLKILRKNKIKKEWKLIKNKLEHLDPLVSEVYIYQLNFITRTYLSLNTSEHFESKTTTELKHINASEFRHPDTQSVLIKLSETADKILHAELASELNELKGLKQSAVSILEHEYRRRLKEVKV